MYIMCNIDKEKQKKEPNKKLITEIQKRIISSDMNCKTKLTTLPEKILNGQSFCPALLDGEKKIKSSWKSQQIFVIEIEMNPDTQSVTHEKILNICKGYEISLFLGYGSFALPTEMFYYRLCFALYSPIIDIKEAQKIQNLFNYMFSSLPVSKNSILDCYIGADKNMQCPLINNYAVNNSTWVSSLAHALYNQETYGSPIKPKK